MPKVHLLNVAPGDCSIIEHSSGRITMIDICDGNLEYEFSESARLAKAIANARYANNLRMCENPTASIKYFLDNFPNKKVFRFILSHPDMDHLDGFANLLNIVGISNFWETGSRREKPNFSTGPYKEEDWDKYVEVREGRVDGITTAIRKSDDRFAYANKDINGNSGGDGLYILAPDENLINDPDMSDDVNDGSFVILYKSAAGKIILPGDATDASWDYIIKNSPNDLKDCAFLLAPHHGRDSGRSYEFLDYAKPKLTLIGCSPSKYIDYDQWHRRGLKFLTSNQVGNVVLEIVDRKIEIYVENQDYAEQKGWDLSIVNEQGYTYIGEV